ncbi:MAG: acetyl-CoA carboxylase biotin carboxyl carrier protein [Calditrichia bacterium]|nr:acetyl-CoA carboxylase biotin carboxyl carrier protein [Calditrichia bacterium]
MNIREIRQLIKLVENSEIGELEIVEEGKKLRISKNSKNDSNGVMAMNPAVMNYAAPVAAVPQVAAPADAATAEEPSAASEYQELRSPMVGTFYRAPSPEADAYVDVGQNVDTGQTLCIIEAMKLMNEIESDFSGKVVKIMVENAQPVEFNQVLFLIEK